MEPNYVTIFMAGVASMVVGVLWYGPLFGKKWMEICGATDLDIEKRKHMQKEAMPLYALQFILTLLQLVMLTKYIKGWTEMSGVEGALWIWLGFIMPTIAGSAMWNNHPTKVKWAMFLIQAGYQFVMFIIYGWMLNEWGFVYN